MAKKNELLVIQGKKMNVYTVSKGNGASPLKFLVYYVLYLKTHLCLFVLPFENLACPLARLG